MSTPKGKIVKRRSIRRRKHARVFYGNLKGQKPSLGLLAATTTGLLGVAGKEKSSSPTTSGTPVLASCSSRSYKKLSLQSQSASTSQGAQAGPSSASQPPSQPGLSSSSPLPSTSAAPEDNTGDYHFIRASSLMRAISAFSCCGTPLTLTEDRRSRRGFVVKMAICCKVCGKESVIMDPYSSDDLEVNTRSLVAARMMGKGRNGLATFAGIMGMPSPLTRPHISLHNEVIQRASSSESQANMLAAAAHLREMHKAKDDDILDVKVTCDGTWQRRGHQSLFGVVIVASWDTGQVLDTEVLSKWCMICNSKRHLDPTSQEFLDWWEEHQAFCEADFYDKSGSMEVEGALRIWKRSVEQYKLRYTEMISDGDASTFSKVSAARPYGSNHPITKHECIGHVQKRMYNHLKEMKKKGNRGADGKIVRMGGRNRLTNELMKKFQKYYGKAIRSNVSSIQEMKDAVMATFFHSCSTDTNPRHHLCPSGTTSWCKHRRAEATGEPPPQHRTTIVAEIAPFVRKVYEDLSADSLLQRCLLGASQNQNESFNSLIWNRCPKTEFSSAIVVQIAVDLAVITFNSGQGALRGLLQRLKFYCGPSTVKFLAGTDDVRVWMAEYKGKELVKKRRQQMRLDRVILEEEQDGGDYDPGGY